MFIRAAGDYLAPVFVFPRENYTYIMLSNDPQGALRLANISGWMNAECAIKALENLLLHMNPDHQLYDVSFGNNDLII